MGGEVCAAPAELGVRAELQARRWAWVLSVALTVTGCLPELDRYAIGEMGDGSVGVADGQTPFPRVDGGQGPNVGPDGGVDLPRADGGPDDGGPDDGGPGDSGPDGSGAVDSGSDTAPEGPGPDGGGPDDARVDSGGTGGPMNAACASDADCAGSLVCNPLNTADSPKACLPLCDSHAECTVSGSHCVIPRRNASGIEVPGVTLCSSGCDLVTSSECRSATACIVSFDDIGAFTHCADLVNDRRHGEPCSPEGECAPGHVCLTETGFPGTCAKWCRRPHDPSCPAGTYCGPLAPDVYIDGVEFGACVAS